MAWVVAPNIKALFASVNRLAPGRDKASDGTIGDLAHSTGTSGHNPDDTAGVKAERTDADSVAEVRAGDVDKDLRHPTVTLEQVVQTVVKTPNLRKRLIYVIYNRRIWSASNGWRQATYTGSNPHDKHAHFSGHPDYDNDASPWREIEQLGEDHDVLDTKTPIYDKGPSERQALADLHYAEFKGNKVSVEQQSLARIEALLGVLAARDIEDVDTIVAGVLAGLTPEKIAAAIPAAVAKQVADELTRRLAA